jgi:hypothetical protein
MSERHMSNIDRERSLEEAAEMTLWRLLSLLQTMLRRNETREQRIERLADELAKALGR